MRNKSLGVLTLLALVVGACGGGDSDPQTGDDEPVLQIVSEGGFVPIEFALGNGPRYTLLGDGRLIFQGAQTMEFPGRLVAPFFVAQLSDSQMNAVRAMVDRIGLPDFVDEVDNTALNFVADAANDIITYWDENGQHRLSVYTLGLQIDEPTDRNAAFLELVETLDRFTGEAPAEAYVGERVRVMAGPGFANDEFPDQRPWPLDESWEDWQELPTEWVCRAFTPDVLELFDDATQATTWEVADVFSFSTPAKILVRPLHPGEDDCPTGP